MGLVEDRVTAVGNENDEGDKAADANFVIDREFNPILSHPNLNTYRYKHRCEHNINMCEQGVHIGVNMV